LLVNHLELNRWEALVDVCLVIKQRLEELGLERRELAVAAEVIRCLLQVGCGSIAATDVP
jgi:hypothetical protein